MGFCDGLILPRLVDPTTRHDIIAHLKLQVREANPGGGNTVPAEHFNRGAER